MRLWRLRRADQFNREYIRRDIHLHERESLISVSSLVSSAHLHTKVSSFLFQPERIQGGEYSVKSDVWSLGITIIELALGRFPFSQTLDSDDEDDSDLEDLEPPAPRTPDSPTTPTKRDSMSMSARARRRRSKGVSLHGGGMTMSIIELMHQIVKEPAPRLSGFPREAEDFVDACLIKDLEARKTPGELMVSRSHPIQ